MSTTLTCQICTNGYGGTVVPAILMCCGEQVCFDCAEKDRNSKISELIGNRKFIKCMLCNQEFHSSKHTPWKVNKPFIELMGIEVDLSAVKKAQEDMQNASVQKKKNRRHNPGRAVQGRAQEMAENQQGAEGATSVSDPPVGGGDEQRSSSMVCNVKKKKAKRKRLKENGQDKRVRARVSDHDTAAEQFAYLLERDEAEEDEGDMAWVEWENGTRQKIPKSRISMVEDEEEGSSPNWRTRGGRNAREDSVGNEKDQGEEMGGPASSMVTPPSLEEEEEETASEDKMNVKEEGPGGDRAAIGGDGDGQRSSFPRTNVILDFGSDEPVAVKEEPTFYELQKREAKNSRKYGDRVLLARQSKIGMMKLGGGNQASDLFPKDPDKRLARMSGRYAMAYNCLWNL